MPDFVPFHRPHIAQEEIDAVVEALESRWLTTGPKVKEFEAAFAAATGARHAVAVNSCTAGLHLALEAIGTRSGEAVITTPMTFGATAEVVRYFDAHPVFVDIEPGTMNMDVSLIEAAMDRCRREGMRVRAVLPVHYAGQPCCMDEILGLAECHGFRVIEDAAHAFPASYRGKKIGSIGDATSFSFYATKTMTTGEGGMVTTDDEALARRMRIMSLHGISSDAWDRYSAKGDWYYEIIAPGYKYNMTDVAASLGLVQLKKTPWLQQERERVAAIYDRAFSGMPQLELPVVAEDVGHSRHLYVIRLNLETLTIDRKSFIEGLKERGVGASVHFIPLHIQPYYRDRYGYRPEDLPEAYRAFERIVSLPIYPGMSGEETDRVIEAVSGLLSENSR